MSLQPSTRRLHTVLLSNDRAVELGCSGGHLPGRAAGCRVGQGPHCLSAGGETGPLPQTPPSSTGKGRVPEPGRGGTFQNRRDASVDHHSFQWCCSQKKKAVSPALGRKEEVRCSLRGKLQVLVPNRRTPVKVTGRTESYRVLPQERLEN